MEGTCECGDESSGSIEWREFLDWMRDSFSGRTLHHGVIPVVPRFANLSFPSLRTRSSCDRASFHSADTAANITASVPRHDAGNLFEFRRSSQYAPSAGNMMRCETAWAGLPVSLWTVSRRRHSTSILSCTCRVVV